MEFSFNDLSQYTIQNLSHGFKITVPSPVLKNGQLHSFFQPLKLPTFASATVVVKAFRLRHVYLPTVLFGIFKMGSHRSVDDQIGIRFQNILKWYNLLHWDNPVESIFYSLPRSEQFKTRVKFRNGAWNTFPDMP
jgi:hypothetical protein